MKRLLQKFSVLSLLVMMSVASWADTVEKTIYTTKFQDWDDVSSSTTESTVAKKTTDGRALTFSLMETACDNDGTNTKFTSECITAGYLIAAKTATPYIKTSALKSVTTVTFVHAATGGNRGWGLKVKGDGDADWVTISTAAANPSGGQAVTVNVNRTNVQLWFYNLNSSQNAYMTSLEIKGNVEQAARTFKDFKVDFRSNPYTVSIPESGTLPTGVQVTGTWHDGQHGYNNGTVVVPVDGAVKFTVGGCTYGNDVTVTNQAGEVIATLATKVAGCDSNTSSAKNVVWTYNSEATDVLTFTYSYLSYFYAEKTDYIEDVTVSYYNTDGKLIGEESVAAGSKLAFNAEYAAKVTVEDGYAFRGWFGNKTTAAAKVKEGIDLTADTKLYAKASKIENPQVGDIFSYDFAQSNFYVEDHEAITSCTGAWHDGTHGFSWDSNGTLGVKVAGNAVVQLTLCKYGNAGTIIVTDANGAQVGDAITVPVASDGGTASVNYTGAPTTLTFTFSAGGYLHNMTIYNVYNAPTKNDQGYYTIAPGDAASLKLVAAMLKDGDKIYLPNGTYDLGSDLTNTKSGITISANNVSIIGESMGGTIVKGYGTYESINTATVKTTGDNFYAQDVTFECYAAWASGDGTAAERALGLWNKSAHSTLKNVYLKGWQDTYYTNGAEGQLGYVEGGKIEGTVDYICGAGTHYFKGVNLNCTNSETKTKGDYIAVPATYASEKGYVFDGCNVTAEAGQIGTYYLGRAWGGDAANTFVNTTFTNAYAAAVWGPNMGSFTGTRRFAVYPAIEGIANDEAAMAEADATISNILGDWSATAQAEANQVTTWPTDDNHIYLTSAGITSVKPTSGYARVANSRGGFGPTFDAAAGMLIEPFSKNPATNKAYGYGSKATGGAGGEIVKVTTAEELYNALDNNRNNNSDAKIVVITKDITTTYPIKLYNVKNKTLLAKTGVKLTNLTQDADNSGILFFSGNANGSSQNLIIRNITFVGPGAYDCDGQDLLSFSGVEDAWVDHCDFQDGVDDCFDTKAEMSGTTVKYNTDNITVSWCRFHYLKEPKAGGSGGSDDHRFANLVGTNLNSMPTDGRYTMTWAYNWWDEGCKERMIRMRNTDVHFINDVWTSSVANYYCGPGKCSGRFDGCWFQSSSNIWKPYDSTTAADNPVLFTNCHGDEAKMVSQGTVPNISYTYGYDTADDAYTLVTGENGAGATLIVDEQGNISVPTAVNSVKAESDNTINSQTAGKYLQNGQVIIMKDGKKYTAAGVEVK